MVAIKKKAVDRPRTTFVRPSSKKTGVRVKNQKVRVKTRTDRRVAKIQEAVHVRNGAVGLHQKEAKSLSGRFLASSKKIKKSKYNIDLADVADSLNVSELVSFVFVNDVWLLLNCVHYQRTFLFQEITSGNNSGVRIIVKDRQQRIVVKCESFLKKEDVRVIIKKFLKTLNLVHLTKVMSSSKSAYRVVKK